MKHWTTLFRLSLVCLLLPLLAGCNDEDDISGIFVERTWYVTELYNADGRTSSLDEAQHQQLGYRRDAYRISFTPETFNAQAGSTTLTGTWTVDGSNQTIRFHFDRPVTGEDAISRIMIKYLEEAVRYEGSYIYLRIYTEAGTSILFSPDK